MAYLWRDDAHRLARRIGPHRSRPRGLTRIHRKAWWARFDLIRARLALVDALARRARALVPDEVDDPQGEK